MLLNRILPILTTLSILTGCGLNQSISCSSNEHAVVTETLYFGTAMPGGIVTIQEWETFINEVVLPAFPDGLTSWTAAGRWRMATGVIEQETSHVLQLTHDGSEEYFTAIGDLVRKYKEDFQQEAVMRVRAQACRSF